MLKCIPKYLLSWVGFFFITSSSTKQCVHKIATNVWIYILHPEPFLNSLISSYSLLSESFDSVIHAIMLTAGRNNFNSSFLTRVFFMFSSFLVVLIKSSRNILNYLNGYPFWFQSLVKMLADFLHLLYSLWFCRI